MILANLEDTIVTAKHMHMLVSTMKTQQILKVSTSHPILSEMELPQGVSVTCF